MSQKKQAVSLVYDGYTAPVVTAKGDGELAQQIIAIAEEHGVPLEENPAMVDLLMNVELGDEIPRVLYIAVAELLAFVYQFEK